MVPERKFLNVIGTRAGIIKTAPVIRKLGRASWTAHHHFISRFSVWQLDVFLCIYPRQRQVFYKLREMQVKDQIVKEGGFKNTRTFRRR
jgi:hypothetical protein